MFGKVPSEKIVSLIERHKPKKIGRAYIPACGYGGLVIYLLDRGWSVTATDTNKSALDYVAQARSKSEQSRLALRQQDVRASINDNFDLIVLSNVLHFFSSDVARRCIENIAETLEDKGVLIIRALGDRDDLRAQGKFFPTAEELQQILVGQRLSVLETERYEVTESHPPIGRHCHDVLIFAARREELARSA